MSDEEERALERVWRSTSAPADGAAWLQARLRSGELSHASLEQAAYAGDEPARLALGETERPAAPATMATWVQGFAHWDPNGPLRAAAIAVRAVVEAYEAGGRTTDAVERAREIVSAIDEWLACPCDAHSSDYCRFWPLGRPTPEGAWLGETLLFATRDDLVDHEPYRAVDLAVIRLSELAPGPDVAARLRVLLIGRRLAEHHLRPLRVDDPEAAKLLARVRAGSLDLARLRLGALVGDRGALAALGLSRPIDDGSLVIALQHAGPEACRVAARSAKVVAGLRPHTSGAGRRPLAETDVGEWVRIAYGHAGPPALVEIRAAVARWALA